MLLFCDSYATTVDLTSKYANPTVFATGNGAAFVTGRFDSSAMKFIASGWNAGTLWTNNFGNNATLIAGAAINVGNVGTASLTTNTLIFGDNQTTQLNLQFNSTSSAPGTFQVQRAGTNLGSASTATMSLNAWHYLEMQATINSSTGSVTVWLDGVQIINLTGQNTQNTANAFANMLGFGTNGGANIGGNQAGPVTYDDVYVINTSGSYNNSRLGDIKVAGSTPTGNGTATAWTQAVAARANSTVYALGATILDTNSNLQRVTTAGTSGASAPTWNVTVGGTTTDSSVVWTNLGTQSAYQLVNEKQPADDDSSYLSDATIGDQSRFTFPAVTGGSVKGVMVYARARKDDAGTRSIRTVAKSGATIGDNGSDLAMAATYQNFATLFETDPNTSSPWSVAAVNAAEFGVKTTA